MSESLNMAAIRRVYNDPGNPLVFQEILSENATWTLVEGFPYSGTYTGVNSILEDFFGRLLTNVFESIIPYAEFFYETNEHIIVLGIYKGKTKAKNIPFTARFTHTYKVKEGKVISFHQCADTIQIARALDSFNMPVK
jgi:ketosteroid isomerase-like protein